MLKTRPTATRSKCPKTAIDAPPCTQDRVSVQPPATAEELRRAADLAGMLLALRSRPRPACVVAT